MSVFQQLNRQEPDSSATRSGGVFGQIQRENERRTVEKIETGLPKVVDATKQFAGKVTDSIKSGVEQRMSQPAQVTPSTSSVHPKTNQQLAQERLDQLKSGQLSPNDLIRPTETFGGKLKELGTNFRQFDRGMRDGLTFGLDTAINRRLLENEEDPNIRALYQRWVDDADTTPAKVGGFAGAAISGAGAYGLIGNLGRSIAQPLLRTGVRGAAAGGVFGALGEAADMAMDTRQDGANTIGQRLGNIGLEAALGGALDIGIDAVGKGVRELFRNRTPETANVRQPETPQVDEPVQNVTRPTELTQESPTVTTQPETPPRVQRGAEPQDEFLQIAEEVAQPRIRDRVYNYLDEAEKAARERIASRRNRLSANPLDEWGDYAIVMAAKVGKGTIKAADFTEELVKEFGEQVRPYANQILRRTQEELRKQTRKATKEADDAIRFNSGGGDANTFRSKIDRNPKRSKQSFSERWERLRTHTIDDMAALEGLEKNVRGRLSSAEDSLYKTARLFKGAPSKANNIVQERLSPIAREIESAGYSMEDLGDYALAMHARDVNSNYMKSGFTDAEIKSVIDKYANTPLENARRSLMQISNELLEELADSQVISRDLLETLKTRWPNYMPLFRSFDDDMVNFESGLSSTLANVSSPIKTLKGSERDVIDPVESMIKNIFKTVNAAERNRVALQLSKLAKEPNAEGFIRKLDPNEKVERKNVVTVKENGENVKYEVDPNVYKAMLNLDKESSNMLINILSKPASMLRAGATLTPEFSLRNPMRDIVQAYVVSNSGFNPLIDFPIGLIEAIKGRKGNSQLYSQWVNDLGDFGNLMSMDRRVHREALEKVFKQPAGKKFVNIVNGRSFLNMLRAISDTTESATKLGEYRAALRKGVSRQEAAYRSRDIMDFARAGSSVRQANKIVAFLNANIQGKSKLLRAFKNNPWGTTARAFTSITLPTVAAFMMQKYMANDTQRNTIEEAPDWMKDTFWLIPVPGTDTVARIPKPFDLAPIFSNLPERTLEYVYNEDKEAFDGFFQRSMGDAALPVQITGLWPFIEGMTNYSFFREGNIIPQREQGLAFRDQYDPVRTTETARVLASGVEAITGGEGMFKNFSSPRIMDNTIQGLTAGLGSYATSAIDALLKNTGLVDRPQAPEKRLEQQPFLKAFTVDPMQSSKSLDKFYTMKEKLTSERSSARINEKEFTKEGEYQVLNKAGNLMSDINKAIRTIESSDLSASEKRSRIEEFQKQRLEISRRAIQLIEGTR